MMHDRNGSASDDQTPIARLIAAIDSLIDEHPEESMPGIVNLLPEDTLLAFARSASLGIARARKRRPAPDPRQQEFFPELLRNAKYVKLKKGKLSILAITPALIRERMVVLRAELSDALQLSLSKIRINNTNKLNAEMEAWQELLNGMEPYQDPRMTAEEYLKLRAAGKHPPSRPKKTGNAK